MKEVDIQLEVLMAGARLNQPEQSNARETRFYRNPADVVEFEAERERKRVAKKAKSKRKGK
jgi:hypothetical protein